MAEGARRGRLVNCLPLHLSLCQPLSLTRCLSLSIYIHINLCRSFSLSFDLPLSARFCHPDSRWANGRGRAVRRKKGARGEQRSNWICSCVFLWRRTRPRGRNVTTQNASSVPSVFFFSLSASVCVWFWETVRGFVYAYPILFLTPSFSLQSRSIERRRKVMYVPCLCVRACFLSWGVHVRYSWPACRYTIASGSHSHNDSLPLSCHLFLFFWTNYNRGFTFTFL